MKFMVFAGVLLAVLLTDASRDARAGDLAPFEPLGPSISGPLTKSAGPYFMPPGDWSLDGPLPPTFPRVRLVLAHPDARFEGQSIPPIALADRPIAGPTLLFVSHRNSARDPNGSVIIERVMDSPSQSPNPRALTARVYKEVQDPSFAYGVGGEATSYSDTGLVAGVVGTGLKYGRANTFGVSGQVIDRAGEGPAIGAEFNIVTFGPDPAGGLGARRVLDVLPKTLPGKDQAEVGTGVAIRSGLRNNAGFRHGLAIVEEKGKIQTAIWIDTAGTAIQAREGAKIRIGNGAMTFEDGAWRFDPPLPSWSWPMALGTALLTALLMLIGIGVTRLAP